MREPNGLTQCLVERAEAAFGRSHRARLKALLASLCVQTALLCDLLMVPLLVNGEKPRVLLWNPVPPYKGVPGANTVGQAREHAEQSGPETKAQPNWLIQPPRVPGRINAPEPDASGEAPGVGPGYPESLLRMPGGSDLRGWAAQLPTPESPARSDRVAPRSEGVQQALLIHRIQPLYPELARQIRLEGVVQLRAVIAKDGTMRLLEVVSGHPLLARAAMDAVLQWHYMPTLLNGEPVEVETFITVVFQLER